MAVEANVVINRPPAQVFDFVADFEKVPRWNAQLLRVRRIASRPDEIGAVYDIEARAMKRGTEMVVKGTVSVTAYEPPSRIGFAFSRFGPLAPSGSFTFEPVEGGTRVVYRADLNLRWPFKLISTYLTQMSTEVWNENLAALKRELEGSPETV